LKKGVEGLDSLSIYLLESQTLLRQRNVREDIPKVGDRVDFSGAAMDADWPSYTGETLILSS
jgi:hypothetical protein